MNGSLHVNKHMYAYDVCDASSGYYYTLLLFEYDYKLLE
jgi:hypothetical protein